MPWRCRPVHGPVFFGRSPYTDNVLLRFGAFELDTTNGELRKAGVLIKLAPQPLQVLQLLAENPGDLRTREDIQRQIWGNDTFVDFDRNLNVCVAQVRAALNDDSESPRFIQTVPRKGYRFLAPVEKIAGNSGTGKPAGGPAAAPGYRPTNLLPAVIAALGVLVTLAIGYFVWQRRSTRVATPVARVMIAALPFENLTGEAEDEPFVEGLTEELIADLGSLHPAGLGVIARSSVMRYKAAPHAINQVGRDLSVDYVIEGTVRRSDRRLRVTARLVKVSDQAQAWNEAYEQEYSNRLEMEQDAAARIAAGVAGRLFAREPPLTARFHVQNQEAYEAYRKGRYLEHKGNPADIQRSLPHFEEAARLDPRFAGAYAAIADACVRLARSGKERDQSFLRAKSAAQKALALDPSQSEAHNALANVLFWRDWSWKDAQQHFTRAIEINPSFSAAHHDYAWLLLAMGRTEPALASLRRAIALDPLSARVNIDAGWMLLQAHRFEEAARQARRTLELEPDLPEAHACLSRAFLFQKDYHAAIDHLTHAMPQLKGELAGPDPEVVLQRFYRSKLQEAERVGNIDTYTMATRYAFLGEAAKALEALERAYDSHNPMMPLLQAEPAFASLHDQPRFRALVQKLGTW